MTSRTRETDSPRSSLDARVDVAHSKFAFSLLQNLHNCIANGAELASAIRRDAASQRVRPVCLLPVASRETLEESCQVVV